MHKFRFVILLAGLVAVLTVTTATAAEQIVIGTGPVAGAYFPAGGALCRLVNRAEGDGSLPGSVPGGLRCFVESTAGSEENLRRLRAGELDFALLQSDWQYYAGRDGTGQPSDDGEAVAEADLELRAVVSLHSQPFTLLARPESGVAAFKDLEDKTVDLGAPDSALGKAARVLVEALGLDEGDFAEVTALAPSDLAEALCGGRIDAFLMPVAHPNGIVAAATERCGARLVPIEGPSVDVLLEAWPFYTPASIPGGLYLGNSQAVASFGLRATLVTSTRVAENTVHRLVRALFEGLDELRGQHPALATLNAEQMVAQGNTLAFHEGALRYYWEQGWLQPEGAP